MACNVACSSYWWTKCTRYCHILHLCAFCHHRMAFSASGTGKTSLVRHHSGVCVCASSPRRKCVWHLFLPDTLTSAAFLPAQSWLMCTQGPCFFHFRRALQHAVMCIPVRYWAMYSVSVKVVVCAKVWLIPTIINPFLVTSCVLATVQVASYVHIPEQAFGVNNGFCCGEVKQLSMSISASASGPHTRRHSVRIFLIYASCIMYACVHGNPFYKEPCIVQGTNPRNEEGSKHARKKCWSKS